MKKLYSLLLALPILACSVLTPSSTAAPSTRAATLAPAAAEIAVPTEDPFHVQPNQQGKYKHYPPSSGVHYGQYLNWGIYTDEVPPEFWVHSLEHGGIVILYNCAKADDCTKTQQALKKFYNAAPPDPEFKKIKLLISPNSKITYHVTALAWGYELNLGDVNQDALLKFYEKYVNQGPELVP